jgi:hypothetical protein
LGDPRATVADALEEVTRTRPVTTMPSRRR